MEDVIIVGAGLSGLATAYHLEQAGLSPVILDAADRVGGRIATDEVEGFLLDRGFQIWLTNYPEGKALLDPWALDLRPFTPGALCWMGEAGGQLGASAGGQPRGQPGGQAGGKMGGKVGGKVGGFARLSDPRRDPAHLLATAFSPATTFLDKLRTARLLFPLLSGTPDNLLPPTLPDAPTPSPISIPDARTGRVLNAPDTSSPDFCVTGVPPVGGGSGREAQEPSGHPPAPHLSRATTHLGTPRRGSAPKPTPLTDRRRLTTLDYLRAAGLSDRALRAFFRPFLAGVLLEDRLDTLAGFAMYTLRMFATGEATLPAGGMAAIPRQLASRLTRTRIELNSPVTTVEPGEVLLADGRRLTARAVVVATEDPAARTLLHLPPCPAPPKSTACLYFAAPEPPPSAREPILHLDGTGTGPINTVVFPSVVQPTYAPQGQTLVSLSTVGLPRMPDDALRTAALAQMRTWFGPQVGGWRHLRTYRIPHALPAADPASRPTWKLPARITQGLYRAGDALDSPSSQGALASARRAADAVLADLR